VRGLAGPLLAAAGLYALAALLLFLGADAFYGADGRLPAAWGTPLGLTVLALAGLAGGGCSVLGLHRLCLRARLRVAVPIAALICAPLLLVAAVCDYMLLLALRVL